MTAFVGVTDKNWYWLLYETGPVHPEVNFWLPSGNQGFKALDVGEPFLFKTHVDRTDPIGDRIVGVGSFSGYARATTSEVWESFGLANGVESLEGLRERVARYRKAPVGRSDDPLIGCILLQDAVFFAPEDTLSAPGNFSPNIVRGRTYSAVEINDTESVAEAIIRYHLIKGDQGVQLGGRTQGDPVLATPRIGQQAFKLVVAEKYGHHCAITGEKVRPVLEAAHILPVADGGQHRIDNGLLLRSDVHTLFDRGYLGVDLKYQLRVSPLLRDQFGNGDFFYAKEGEKIDLPRHRSDRPNREFLEWHNDTVFLSA
jgi:putative restriction endonuclease